MKAIILLSIKQKNPHSTTSGDLSTTKITDYLCYKIVQLTFNYLYTMLFIINFKVQEI